jgi:hypothetical protein
MSVTADPIAAEVELAGRGPGQSSKPGSAMLSELYSVFDHFPHTGIRNDTFLE